MPPRKWLELTLAESALSPTTRFHVLEQRKQHHTMTEMSIGSDKSDEHDNLCQSTRHEYRHCVWRQ